MGGDDPQTGSALVGGVDWARDTLLGSAATIAAVLAVATIGVLMLSGRVPARRGANVILGCFILFSAGIIADGLVAGTQGSGPEQVAAVEPPAYAPTVPRAAPYDPYAGAASPIQPSFQPAPR